MREAGVDKVRIVESGGDVGGTWYWNRYPGAACDVESYIYLPLLEETGYMPTERYTKAAEISAHCRRIAEHYKLYDDACFSTMATSLDWDPAAARWTVRTDRGDVMQARFVVLTTGPLNRPKLPNIPGIESFKGHSFHTSRWDYEYTGGTATEPLAGLADKRVGIIGTGATAIQCVPPLARSAQHLSVFQRTPSSVDARDNAPTDPEWAASLEPGWQQRRIESFTNQLAGNILEEDLVADGWTVLARAMRVHAGREPGFRRRPGGAAGARGHGEDGADPRADEQHRQGPRHRRGAEALVQPVSASGPASTTNTCSRSTSRTSPWWDTAGKGVERITETGVVAAGREYPIDCLIYATGFEVNTDFSQRSGFAVRGVDGVSLTDKWGGGMSTLHGMHSRGFPNCFVLSHSQSGMSVNFPHMLSEQSKHLAHMVEHCLSHGVRTLEATAAAEQTWVGTIIKQSEGRRKFLETCTPGYYNNEGNVTDATSRSAPYGARADRVSSSCCSNGAEGAGDFEGLELDGEPVPAKVLASS